MLGVKLQFALAVGKQKGDFINMASFFPPGKLPIPRFVRGELDLKFVRRAGLEMGNPKPSINLQIQIVNQ